MDIELNVKTVAVNAIGYKSISVYLENISVSEIISQIGVGKILDEIGKAKAIDYFEIEEA